MSRPIARPPAQVPARLAAALVVALLTSGGALAQPADDPPPSAVRLLLPDDLVDAAVVRGDGGRDLLALVLEEPRDPGEGADARGEAAPRRRVWVYDPARRTLVPRGGLLPEGSPELAVTAPGRLWAGLARYGGLDLMPRAGQEGGGPAGTAASLPLPRRAARTARGLELTSPGAVLLPDPTAEPAAPPCAVTEPEAQGRERLRVLLLCPEREPEEIWALLPGSETVTASRVALLDGAPALAVLTREQLGLFVKQDLRLFPLAGSTNRLGTGPILAARTDCPLWRGSELSFSDADGDGLDDLVVVCRTGLMDPELRVEVYRHRAPDERGGAFETRPRVTRIEGDFGVWHHGTDWTGDGLPDLLVLDDGRLHVHAGAARGRPVDPRPARTLALPAAPAAPDGADTPESRTEVTIDTSGGGTDVRSWQGGPVLVGAGDLDGDGRPEVVVRRGRGVVLVVTL